VARHVLQMHLRGHPALEPLEAEAGFVVVVPLPARGRVRERALPLRGGASPWSNNRPLFNLIIYELMPNGSLDATLQPPQNRTRGDWI
jgi:hypothetical protein